MQPINHGGLKQGMSWGKGRIVKTVAMAMSLTRTEMLREFPRSDGREWTNLLAWKDDAISKIEATCRRVAKGDLGEFIDWMSVDGAKHLIQGVPGAEKTSHLHRLQRI